VYLVMDDESASSLSAAAAASKSTLLLLGSSLLSTVCSCPLDFSSFNWSSIVLLLVFLFHTPVTDDGDATDDSDSTAFNGEDVVEVEEAAGANAALPTSADGIGDILLLLDKTTMVDGEFILR